MNKTLHNKSKARARKEMISQGAYDGRFTTKVVSDKKKDQYLKLRREKHNIY